MMYWIDHGTVCPITEITRNGFKAKWPSGLIKALTWTEALALKEADPERSGWVGFEVVMTMSPEGRVHSYPSSEVGL